MLVTLVPKSTPSARGEAWRVIDKRSRVSFSKLLGPWWLVVRAGRPPGDLSAKWVHALQDGHYKIMPGAPG